MGKFVLMIGIVVFTAIIGFGFVGCADEGVIPVALQNPVAGDFDIGNLNQTAGNVTPVAITPKTGKSNGAITIFYNGSTTLPAAAGTYTVTFNVAASAGWNAASGLAGGTLTVSAGNQNPAASDFDIWNLTQTAGNVTAVMITPKAGKSGGAITIFYNSSPALPAAVGFYVVTFNVAESAGWNAANGLVGGVLTISTQVNALAPDITTQPTGGTVIFGGNHSLSIAANSPDGGTLTYQWYSNTSASNTSGTAISGAVLAVFDPLTIAAGTFYYFVEVTNTISDNSDGGNKTAAIRSNAVILTVNAQVNALVPEIINHPVDTAVTVNVSHNLFVGAESTDGGTLSYQWYSNTSASNIGGSLIFGAVSATYNPPTGTVGTFYYFAVVTNTISDNGDGGTKTATARSDAMTLTVNVMVNARAPNITTQPADGTVIFGGSHSLSVVANSLDGGTLSYQWYSNTSHSNSGGTPIAGAVSANYNPPTGTAGTRYYFVIVTDTIPDNGDGGSKTAYVRSNAVTMTVNAQVNAQAPNITSQPVGGTVIFGGSHSLSVTANSSDGGTLTYQWYSNTSASNSGGTLISGAASATYNPPTGTFGTYYYFVQITNTIANNGDGGIKTATTRSYAVTLTVVAFIEMVWVPGGSFVLGREIGFGSIGTGSFVYGDITPVSTVTLTGFHIGKYEVTQEQYQAVMGSNPSWFTTANGRPPATGETDAKRPVENVSWYDAIVFCNRLSIMEGLTPAYSINGSTNPNDWGSVPTSSNAIWNAVTVVSGSTGYRLPTEAQWEYAAKGGNNPPVGFAYAGSNNANDVAWHMGNSGGRTREVGLLLPNRLGIYDMTGNVSEWCWDRWGSYTSVAKNDPMGPTTGNNRVIRGGGGVFDYSVTALLSIFRESNTPYASGLGFRLLRP